MKKIIKQILFSLTLTLILTLPYFVLAQGASKSTALDRLKSVASKSGPYDDTTSADTLSTTIGVVISAALSLLGVVFIVLIVIAGYKWMMAQGNEKEVTEAQTSMKNAIIGLIVTLSAYAIWQFIGTYIIG
jgi:hypothetical protein